MSFLSIFPCYLASFRDCTSVTRQKKLPQLHELKILFAVCKTGLPKPVTLVLPYLGYLEQGLGEAAKAENRSCFVMGNPKLSWAGNCGVSY